MASEDEQDFTDKKGELRLKLDSAISGKEEHKFKRTLIILAGGESSRLGEEKGLTVLGGKPLVRHVFDRIAGTVDETLVIVRDKDQVRKYRKILPDADRLAVDSFSPNSALAGMITGFSYSAGEYSIVLPCDSPFVSSSLVEYLFERAPGYDAIVPIWPSGYIEPLQSVYKVSSSLEHGRSILARGKNDFRSLINTLESVMYMPTESLRSLAPGLRTFLNINSPEDLKEARRLIEVEKLG